MRAGRGEGDETAVAKHRLDHADIRQMPGALPRVVGDVDVARRCIAPPVSGPNSARKCRTVAGNVPMKDGMLPVFCASECPVSSVSTQAKSLASFDRVENEVRMITFAASSTIEVMRLHRISIVTGSSMLPGSFC